MSRLAPESESVARASSDTAVFHGQCSAPRLPRSSRSNVEPGVRQRSKEELSVGGLSKAKQTWKNFKSVLSCKGSAARVAEHVPLVNCGMQAVHRQRGDEEALQRARRADPLGRDGYVTQAAEHLPLVSNVVQGVHEWSGDQEARDRARRRNPLGSHGVITKTAEQIPIVADGIMAMHRLAGNHAAEERARAHSLQKLLGKDGAVFKVLELLPGSNLVAAAVHETSGNRDEAIRALTLLQNWKGIGSPDGALVKIAEQIPGVDIIAFWVLLQNKRYAHALRSITKTSWVDISVKSVVIVIDWRSPRELSVVGLHTEVIQVHPKAPSLIGGLIDIVGYMLENSSWPRRLKRRSTICRLLPSQLQIKEKKDTGTQLRDTARQRLSDWVEDTVESFVDRLPEIAHRNAVLAYQRKLEEAPGLQGWLMRMLLPETLPEPHKQLQEALREAFLATEVRLTATIPPPQQLRSSSRAKQLLKDSQGQIADASTAACCGGCLAGVGCGSCGCASLGCLAGCVAMYQQARRRLADTFVPWLNARNAGEWQRGSAPPPEPRMPPPPAYGTEPASNESSSLSKRSRRRRAGSCLPCWGSSVEGSGRATAEALTDRRLPAAARKAAALETLPMLMPAASFQSTSLSSSPSPGSDGVTEPASSSSSTTTPFTLLSMPEKSAMSLGKELRHYVLHGVLRDSTVGALARILERPLRGMLAGLVEQMAGGSEVGGGLATGSVPVVVDVDIPAMWLGVGKPGVNPDIWASALHAAVMMKVDLLHPDSWVSGVQACVREDSIRQSLAVLSYQVQQLDLRPFSPELQQFPEAVRCKVTLEHEVQPSARKLKLILSNIETRFFLPP
eukprot:TRINITY_DN39642_c0_g1_i1.p1 TRINITY_DN39642_c0_g1~~TRINITY_DN39642_c0_g1_i1.p1  ORF type:complete len:846 (+),score=181.05 TRINITY_DN39642_c0_g1_i1:63-2600(+)